MIRNDTGVHEGSEISMFYDPMLAKLCAWAPTAPKRVDGHGGGARSLRRRRRCHNIPFLSALMPHPRWRKGELSTGFIAEEFPDGFRPSAPAAEDLIVLAAIALAVELVRRDRLDRLPGRLQPHTGKLKRDWVVRIGEQRLELAVLEGEAGGPASLELDIGGRPFEVASGWRPGDPVWIGTVGGRAISARVRPETNGSAHRMARHVCRVPWRCCRAPPHSSS